MPIKPSRPCFGRGPHIRNCRNLVKGNESYCPVCLQYAKKELNQRNKVYDKERDQSQERHFIHSDQWRKIRLIKLANDPLCEPCLRLNRESIAVLVHHIDSNELNNNANNMQSMCNNCHELVHKQDRFNKKGRK